ncbi:MAG: hypothetical protein JNM30_04405 [Rhodospirillales bacterium]|nr:hypothetical protein [Rhodospirillales bacterium]
MLKCLLAIMLLLPIGAEAQERRFLLAYEAVLSTDVAPPPADQSYADRELTARIVAQRITPAVFAALGLDPQRSFTRVAPGGYLGQTNPSILTSLQTTPERANRLAAAFGFVLRQDSVLVVDFDGEGAYHVNVEFGYRSLTPQVAQAFFQRAILVHTGLGGGFFALDDRMVFLNLRDAGGKPYSGLSDWPFLERLKIAVDRFPGARIGDSGQVGARLVSNNWKTAVNGQDYARTLDDVLPALVALWERHDAILRAAEKRAVAN